MRDDIKKQRKDYYNIIITEQPWKLLNYYYIPKYTLAFQVGIV